MKHKPSKAVDDYIAGFATDVQLRLKQMRATIRKAAPGANETISYSIPAFKTSRMLVWYAAFSNHIGFYPGTRGVAHFKKDLSRYRFAKGSVRFPLDEPLPLPLVARIVKFRLRANSQPKKAEKKTSRR